MIIIPKVIIESPFNYRAGDEFNYKFNKFEIMRQNLNYAQMALDHSLSLGEAPMASHLLYTQVWRETKENREQGIAAGLAWLPASDLHAFYVDLGMSPGMQAAATKSEEMRHPFVIRRLFPEDKSPHRVRGRLRHLKLSTFRELMHLEGF